MPSSVFQIKALQVENFVSTLCKFAQRSKDIFDGRRRKQMWQDAFEPLGFQHVQKVGVELSRGPALGTDWI